MIKYLLIFLLLSFVAYVVYLRLRPYLQFARRAFGFVRDARRMTANDAATTSPRHAQTVSNEKLVRCSSCGTWLPASRALTFRATPNAYCSQECIERTAGEDRTPHAARKL